MSNNENASKQAESDASPNVEPDHVEGAPTADNPPATAGPNDSFLDEKSKHQLRVQQLRIELERKEADNIRKQATCAYQNSERREPSMRPSTAVVTTSIIHRFFRLGIGRWTRHGSFARM